MQQDGRHLRGISVCCQNRLLYGESCATVERQHRREFVFVLHAPSRDTISWTVKRSEETGSVYDKRARGRKRNASVCTGEVVRAAVVGVTRSTRTSLQPVAQRAGVSKKSVTMTCFFVQNAAKSAAVARWNIICEGVR